MLNNVPSEIGRPSHIDLTMPWQCCRVSVAAHASVMLVMTMLYTYLITAVANAVGLLVLILMLLRS